MRRARRMKVFGCVVDAFWRGEILGLFFGRSVSAAWYPKNAPLLRWLWGFCSWGASRKVSFGGKVPFGGKSYHRGVGSPMGCRERPSDPVMCSERICPLLGSFWHFLPSGHGIWNRAKERPPLLW